MLSSFKSAFMSIGFGVVTGLLATPAFAASCEQYYYGTERVDAAKYCSSSHLKPSRVATYSAGNAEMFDPSNRKLAWCEGGRGPGIGEWLELSVIGGGAIVKTLTIANGYQKSKTAFYSNARLKKIRIEMDSGFRADTVLDDSFGDQVIKFANWQDITKVRVTILSVYPGQKYQDTCLTSFGISYTEGTEYEFQQME